MSNALRILACVTLLPACLLLTTVSACGGIAVIEAREYERSCQANQDCVLIIEGNPCCGCSNAAINRSDLERYRDDTGTCKAQCDIGCPDDVEAYCSAGICDIRKIAEQACTPGVSSLCTCSGGASGTQRCKADGNGFDPCVCP